MLGILRVIPNLIKSVFSPPKAPSLPKPQEALAQFEAPKLPEIATPAAAPAAASKQPKA